MKPELVLTPLEALWQPLDFGWGNEYLKYFLDVALFHALFKIVRMQFTFAHHVKLIWERKDFYLIDLHIQKYNYRIIIFLELEIFVVLVFLY